MVQASIFNSHPIQYVPMSLELERHCPDCGEDKIFVRVASTTLELGEKVKWRCSDCSYGFVQIGSAVDTGQRA